MDYIPKILDMTIEECEAEIKQMNYEVWRYGQSIDKPRLWDLNATINFLKGRRQYGRTQM